MRREPHILVKELLNFKSRLTTDAYNAYYLDFPPSISGKDFLDPMVARVSHENTEFGDALSNVDCLMSGDEWDRGPVLYAPGRITLISTVPFAERDRDWPSPMAWKTVRSGLQELYYSVIYHSPVYASNKAGYSISVRMSIVSGFPKELSDFDKSIRDLGICHATLCTY